MLVLDTDHISLLGDPSAAGLKLLARLDAASQPVVTTAISVEENLHGWLQFIHRAKSSDQLIRGYDRLLRRVEFFADWTALGWDENATRTFFHLRTCGVRIPTHDLRIAAIVLSQNAVLLTRNSRDFSQVPNLRFANWLDD